MKHPRKFLIFILILLAINTLFFVAWYAFDLQGVVKGIVEREAGKALQGDFKIEDFSISDRQVYAEGISFAAADSSLNFQVSTARVQFNLLKFIFSGFKIRNILNQVEIAGADVSFIYSYEPRPQKPPGEFEIPDLGEYFNSLKITDSSFRFDLDYPLDIMGKEGLIASEQLNDIQISILNTDVTSIRLTAVRQSKGTISASGILQDGRLASSHAQIDNYIPHYISHPNIRDFSTEINLVLDASQKEKNSPLEVDGTAILWNTQALLLSDFPLQIPLLTVKFEEGKLETELSRSRIGSSSLEGSASFAILGSKLHFEPSRLEAQIDLSLIDPALKGMVTAALTARGTISDPVITLKADSDLISYQQYEARDIELEVAYEDSMVNFALNDASWENQNVRANGQYNPQNRKLSAILDTAPISFDEGKFKIYGAAEVELAFYEKLPAVEAKLLNLSLARGKMEIQSISGYANLIPVQQGETLNYYVDLELDTPEGDRISLVGDILDRNLLLDASFSELALMDIYPLKALQPYDPVVGGEISSFLTGNQLVLSSHLGLALDGDLNYLTGLDLIASYDIATKKGMAILDSDAGTLNGQPLDFSVIARIDEQKLTLNSFNLNDRLYLSGSTHLDDLDDTSIELILRDIGSDLISSYLPDIVLPDISGLDLYANYNRNDSRIINAKLNLQKVNIPGLRPLSGQLNLQGYPEQVVVRGGINNDFKRLVSLTGTLDLLSGLDARLQAVTNQLAMADLMYSPLAEGEIDGNLGVYLSNLLEEETQINFDAFVMSEHMSIPDIGDFDDIYIKISQTPRLLTVDSLSVTSAQFGTVWGSGALDYNLYTNAYYDGDNVLDLHAEGHFFDWLTDEVDIITAAGGNVSLQASLRTFDGQFSVQSGKIDVKDANISLRDQPEQIRKLNIQAVIDNNQLLLNDFSCFIGEGKLTVKNQFDDDPDSHLNVGFLDLGSLKLRIDQPGAIVSIPMFTTPRSISNVILQGQGTPYATVRGPFEDMTISAELLVSNADVVYPPNTDNLLNLIYSFRSTLSKPETQKKDPVPLPFTMDLMIRLRENIRFSTYPTNFRIEPGGFLNIVYDGQEWKAAEASFRSEQGTLDFFGTVFQTESLDVTIIDSQDLVDVSGTFTRRALDGTVITLTVSTDTDTSKPVFERLIFALKSDNPDDRTISSILSRLRYSSSSEELSGTQRGSLLQDEALSLISENLNTSLLAPFLYPLENTMRRLLKLDNFSISAGFIQNLFTEYSNDPNQLAEYTNMDQFMSDITKFSSSILLNNLSLSMSKYLGARLFLDYTLTLQEETDLQKKTRIVVSHDTSLRWILPYKLRLAYTFQYAPIGDNITHEIMLQRSFRFWGL
ncbi:MAG: translocation/assembly module TamB domain-containing protein [Candidatus Syntrophosphaera sp.]